MNLAEITSRWPHRGPTARRRGTEQTARQTGWQWAVDAFTAVALAAASLVDALNRGQHANSLAGPYAPVPHHVRGSGCPTVAFDQYPQAQWWQLLLAVATAAPLVLRRRQPLTVFWAVLSLSFLYHLSPGFDPTYTLTACGIAAFSATMYSPHRIASTVAVATGTALVLAFHKEDVPYSTPGFAAVLLLFLGGLVVNTMHTWKQRARQLEAEQAAATRRAVEDERKRMARELHDVVSHNVSVMTAQAGAARTVLEVAPEQAREAILAVESAGRAAMNELRQVMGLLTIVGGNGLHTQAPADLVPLPVLADIRALAEQVRGTGVHVELTVTGAAPATPTGAGTGTGTEAATPMAPGRDLAAYRVVQEALTNAVKHAPGGDVRITVAHTADAVTIEVTDTGGTRPAGDLAARGGGSGLIGLRERLALHGGTLQTGRHGNGFRVRAVIPTGAT